jgi:chromate transporter
MFFKSETLHRLVELAALFLKLGFVGFGGPAAHIAMMEDEVVRRRAWLTQEEFLDLVGATNLIPGPNSTEMAIHIGQRRAGWPGLLLAGSCFILPAMLIVMGCAWAYTRWGTLPQAGGLLYGIKPVIIAVVAQALWGLGKTALKNNSLVVVACIVAALSFMGANELALLFAAGAVLAVTRMTKPPGDVPRGIALPIPVLHAGFAAAVPAASATLIPFGLWPLFFFFLKVGSVLYGSGYVLLAFLRNGLVEQFGWLTEAQLLDAIAVGQITPGPVFTTATFIGYNLGGPSGAVVATVGIFLPAFFFVAISGPLIPRIRRSPVAGAFLDGVNAASLALMAVVGWQLSAAALVDPLTVLLASLSALFLIRFKWNSAWLVASGAAVGWVSSLLAPL